MNQEQIRQNLKAQIKFHQALTGLNYREEEPEETYPEDPMPNDIEED